jgi:hypothetical protein
MHQSLEYLSVVRLMIDCHVMLVYSVICQLSPAIVPHPLEYLSVVRLMVNCCAMLLNSIVSLKYLNLFKNKC